MIAASSPTVPWGWDPWGPNNGGTVTAGTWPANVTYVVTYGHGYASSNQRRYKEELPPVETRAERRLRLSREGIVRRVKEALSFVCRVRSVWQRVLYVARTAAQSERWRVVAP
jgi:hypothetical protein